MQESRAGGSKAASSISSEVEEFDLSFSVAPLCAKQMHTFCRMPGEACGAGGAERAGWDGVGGADIVLIYNEI